MKNKKTKYYVAFLFSIGLLSAYAQESAISSGADLSGAGGSVSFSIGQVCFRTDTGSAGSIAQGVQQPYEIQVSLGVDEHEIGLYTKVYPNPTTDRATIVLPDLSNSTIQVFSSVGELVYVEQLSEGNTITELDLSDKPAGLYFVKVFNENEAHTARLIKQ